ncbi:MAG: N-acetyltransferase [Chitinophagaceae bacterium]|nr:MAG: N-acetyltransferase [Chitinophagaceae bacterium]
MFPELTTERLSLQQVLPEDQQFIFEGLSHPQVIPFFGVSYDSFEATKKQMDWYAKAYEEDTGGPWKIIEKASGKKIGVIAYYFHKHEHRKAEIGFWLFPEYWNKGFITEAMQPVISYCKNEKNIHRLEAFVEEGNAASSKLLAKAGFQYEGKMKDCEIKNGKYISLLIYGLIL